MTKTLTEPVGQGERVLGAVGATRVIRRESALKWMLNPAPKDRRDTRSSVAIREHKS